MDLANVKFTLSLEYTLPREHLRSAALANQLKALSPHIYDLNVTCRIDPFWTDAMGVRIDPMASHMHLRDALRLQEKSGVTVSALFNNIYVPPTYENLELLVKGLRPFYEAGLRSMTVPHTLWMKMGLIQKTYPEMRFKNTILRRLRTSQDFWNLAEAGYDYVMLDRLMLRQRDVLEDVRKAQKTFEDRYGKRVLLSTLDSENRCRGCCPFWEEHYQHTMTNPRLQNNELWEKAWNVPPSYSCDFSRMTKFHGPILPPFTEDIEELSQFFDVIKVNSRASEGQFTHSLVIVRDIFEGDGNLFIQSLRFPFDFSRYQTWKNAKLVDMWRETIKTCCFLCWKCTLCWDLNEALFKESKQDKNGRMFQR